MEDVKPYLDLTWPGPGNNGRCKTVTGSDLAWAPYLDLTWPGPGDNGRCKTVSGSDLAWAG